MAEANKTNFGKSAFLSQLQNVAPANEFYAYLEVPQVIAQRAGLVDQFKRKISFSAKAANVPDMSVGSIDVPFRSTMVRIPGDRDRSGIWNLTIRVDVDYVVRNVFEMWNDALVGHVDNTVAGSHDVDITRLFGTGEIHQLTKNGRILKTWMFDGIWPSNIGGLNFGWENSNGIVEFDASIVYQHLESDTTRQNELLNTGLL